MNEIKMAAILEKLDKSGAKVKFGTQVPAQLAKSSKPYMTGYMTGAIPANMMNNMFAQGAVGGIGLLIEGEKETPELMELRSYLSRNPHEGASLVRFCNTCLLAGNVPVRKVDNYFICSNGKILIRNGEEFEVVYKGAVLPNLQTMSDEKCLDVIHSAVKTYTNLTNQNQTEEEDLQDIGRSIALASSSSEELNWVHGILSDIERADKNDDVIRQKALMDALISWLEMKERDVDEAITDQNTKKEEPKCNYDEDGQQNWIF